MHQNPKSTDLFFKKISYQFLLLTFEKTIMGSSFIQKPQKKTGLKGFEPLTCGLRVRRYAELSYRPKPVRPSNVVDEAE